MKTEGFPAGVGAWTRSVGVVLGAALLLGGCAPPEPAKSDAAAQSNLPATRVDLPPIIKLEGSIPPETHADHTMRIDGLLARRKKHLNQKILVRGYLIEKHVDCPKDVKRCQRPHGWLADSPAGGEKRLLLANLNVKIAEKLEVGEQYVVTGTFSNRSSDGFVRSEGLLIFEKIDGLEIPDTDDKKRKRRGR